MKKIKQIAVLAMLVISASSASAQEREVSTKNSWLKAGIHAGVPVGDIHDFYKAVAGLELKGQFMTTPHFGIGLTAGYDQYFHGNNNDGGAKLENFGAVPLGAFIRYYPKSSGFFAGLDGGYSFLTNVKNNDGGAFLKPHIGYHNYSWNYFAFYNTILRSDSKGGGINSVGLGASYNIRFKK